MGMWMGKGVGWGLGMSRAYDRRYLASAPTRHNDLFDCGAVRWVACLFVIFGMLERWAYLPFRWGKGTAAGVCGEAFLEWGPM